MTSARQRWKQLCSLGLAALVLIGGAAAWGADGEQSEAADDTPLYLAIDTPPAPVLSPNEALAAFAVAPGFMVELAAAEPVVEDPVAITWDEAGNLYVAEMRGFMPDLYGTNQTDPVGAVVRLVDTDDDGVYDRREVLLDKLVLPRAVTIVNDGLLIGEPPNLWLCPNTDGRASTIDCGQKVLLGEYGNQPGSVEHAENGLIAGLDNWLYNAKSDRRLRLVDGALESQPTLFRGQWGITKDNAGRLYYNTNLNLLLGDSYDAQQVVRAGNTGGPGLNARISTDDQLFAVRVNTGVNRAYVPGVLREDGRLNRPTSASGMAVYRGDQFGAGHGEDVFVTEPAANAVAQLRLTRDGLTVGTEHVLYPDPRWQQREFLASTDERFRPVDVMVGPDGALYVVDFYRGVIQDHMFISEELRAQARERGLVRPLGNGRIWRVTAVEQPRRGLRPALDSVDDQLASLGHANGWQRDTAQRLLIDAEASSVNGDLARLVHGSNALAAVHSLWTLQGRASLTRRMVRRALRRSDPRVRLAALEAGAPLLSARDILGLADTANDAAFAQHLTLSLAPHNARTQVQDHLTATLVREVGDEYARMAVQAAAHTQELAILERLLQAGWDADLEAATDFIQSLTSQGLRNDGTRGTAWLDVAARRSGDAQWLARSVLEGLFEVSRDSDFERIRLEQPHLVFATEDEVLWPAIARARRTFTWPGDDLAADAKPLSPAQAKNREQGAAYYASRCVSCHGETGVGIASLGPPLSGSPWVTGPPEVLARMVLHGLSGPIIVSGQAWDGMMPGHATMPDFSDDVAAGLLTFLRRAWGHSARAVDPELVAEVRSQSAARTQPWTVAELADVPLNTAFRRYEGDYGGGEFTLSFDYNGRELVVRSAIFNGPMEEQREDHFLFAPRQVQLEFVLADDGAVTGVRMQTPDGGVLMPRLVDQ